MGTMIHLYLGGLQIDWGKNYGFMNHSSLFQKQDFGEVQDNGYEEPTFMEGYSRPLGKTIKRLELLGYTMDVVQKEYERNFEDFGNENILPFKEYSDIIKSIDVGKITGRWTENVTNTFIPTDVLVRYDPSFYFDSGKRPDYWDVETLLNCLSPYSKLRLLAENPCNLQLPIIWPFGELVDAGWTTQDAVTSELSQHTKFLIITEGSSDTKIIQTALSVLGEDYKDFFQFIDVEKGQHFDGTESLYKFCKRLVSIGVLNQVIFLFDNDAAGVNRYEDARKLSLPSNINVCKLPDIPDFEKFSTIGPDGETKQNINGRAASIECYLDLGYNNTQRQPKVRWSSFIDSIGEYQGALENKNEYTRLFLSLTHKDPDYDYSKLEILLDHLFQTCVKMLNS